MREKTFAISSGSTIVGASILRCGNGFTALFHHGKITSLHDVVIQPHPEKPEKIHIVARGGTLIKTRAELETHWPTGWNCFRRLVEHIDTAMEFHEPYFSRAAAQLQ